LDHEDFNLDVSSTSSDNEGARTQDAPESPSAPSRQQQQQLESRAGPAGSRKARIAADAFTFFKAYGNKKQCTFCL